MEEDINDAVLWNTGETDPCIFIALRPSVAWELECRGVPYKNILLYGDGNKRWKKTLENFAILDDVTAEIDTGIADFLSIKTLKPALFSFYYLKILMDVITTKILVLRTIISIERPDEIIAFFHDYPKSNSFFPFSEEESVFSYLLELDGWNVPVRIIRPVMQSIPSNISRQVSEGSVLLNELSSLMKEKQYLFNAGFIFSRFGLWQSITAIICSFFAYPPKPVMIYGSGYNWDYSLSVFSKAGIHPVFRLLSGTPDSDESTRATQIYTEILEICKNSVKIRQYTQISGIDASSIIFEKIASIISRSVVACEYEYIRSKKIFEKTRIHCILVSTQAQHSDRAIIQAAHDKGIKVISWQHGGAGFCYHPMMYHAEFFNSDLHLVFGEGVKSSYIKTSAIMGIKNPPRFIAIGSSRLDRESEIINTVHKTSPDSGSIVYITEKFQFNLYYNSTTFDSTEICDHFWVVQKSMLDFTRNHSNRQFVFKFHPADSKGEPVHELMPESITLEMFNLLSRKKPYRISSQKRKRLLLILYQPVFLKHFFQKNRFLYTPGCIIWMIFL